MLPDALSRNWQSQKDGCCWPYRTSGIIGILCHVNNLVVLYQWSTGYLQWIALRLPCAAKYVSGKWVMYVGMSMYGCLSMCAGALQWVACQWREGQRMAQGLSPFLWFNMTPLALRLRQLRMHMPAILFVVGDYCAIKAPVSSSMAGLQNYCFPLDLESFLRASGALWKHRWGYFILNGNEWEYSPND